jgi:hypothetical protein
MMLASTAKASPPTIPSFMQRPTTVSNSFPRRDLAYVPYLNPQCPTLSILPKITLNHEGFGPRPDQDEEAGDIFIAHDLLT